ncbi:kinase-like domain-containing protein [Glomus cerebriforme]|uniref:Kinase-like domain-containing protein n=1 Tax=Glomus cerebriforme TaxID=658196 RepID=A0A397SFN0_9GLOM|nr:kinase-like domain-containing protein [Glomus cerebriforme]
MAFIKNLLRSNKHQSEQEYLSDDVFEQIKDFKYWYLTKKQELLIDKLIINEELKRHYKKYGLCKECKQPNTSFTECWPCKIKPSFKNWSKWIEYDKFENIEYITKGGFGTIYKANWKNGKVSTVALKSLNDSENITLEFLNEINLHLKMNNSLRIIKIYGITKDPKTSNFMMVMDYAEKGNLRQILNSDFNSLGWYDKFEILMDTAQGLDDIHKMGLTHQDFHSGTLILKLDLCVDTIPSKRPTAKYLCEIFKQWYLDIYTIGWKKDSEIYEIYKQSIYTSRLLNFNNLPEPKNVDDEKELKNADEVHTESIEPIDFTENNNF